MGGRISIAARPAPRSACPVVRRADGRPTRFRAAFPHPEQEPAPERRPEPGLALGARGGCAAVVVASALGPWGPRGGAVGGAFSGGGGFRAGFGGGGGGGAHPQIPPRGGGGGGGRALPAAPWRPPRRDE